MIRIHDLEQEHISFQIYTLSKEDSIILTCDPPNNQLLIILDGLVKLSKIFTNEEIVCMGILKRDYILHYSVLRADTNNHYYKALALSETLILSIQFTEIINKVYQKNNLLKQLILSYSYSTKGYKNMIKILSHRQIKNRIIQLILILCEELGQVDAKSIIVPLYLSHNIVSIITGSHRITVARIMKQLQNKKLISYNRKGLIIHDIIRLSRY
uniref:Global nitrogen transcriptional regulator n=1 Tax=Rhodogorgon sp. TaxID=2485824 RepID=A0A3G3MHU1_9FLOR|nr:global nitrogen transcriptional regulator [Rhodogorgon sp.]